MRIYFESMFVHVNEKHILPYANGVLKKNRVQIWTAKQNIKEYAKAKIVKIFVYFDKKVFERKLRWAETHFWSCSR